MSTPAAGRVLVVNTGSSSVKYALVRPAESSAGRVAGRVERIGGADATLRHVAADGRVEERPGPFADHAAALQAMLEMLQLVGRGEEGALLAVGHRVVHGGERFTEPVVVDDEALEAIASLEALAPLHNPPGVLGLRLLRELLPDVPHVAVFDTAFHASMPAVATTYALASDVSRQHGIRRYGFHGTSFRYVARAAAGLLGLAAEDVNLVIAHIGNGASVCAVQRGRSIDTSMGMTPLEGLVMGTRSGDVDAGVLLQLLRSGGCSPDELDVLLNKRSGLKGLTGASDVREVRSLADDGDSAAVLALDVYAYRLRKYLGAYLAVLPEPHAIVFTGGVGENDARLRTEVCGAMGHLGVRLDEQRNAAVAGRAQFIDDGTSALRLLVVPTDEEAEIAVQTAELLSPAAPSRR